MILSCDTAYELMQCTFNVHLSLEDTINVVTWQWGWPLDFRDSTSTPISYVYVDVDFDTHLWLISNWCQ